MTRDTEECGSATAVNPDGLVACSARRGTGAAAPLVSGSAALATQSDAAARKERVFRAAPPSL
jgi:hypothetical protein